MKRMLALCCLVLCLLLGGCQSPGNPGRPNNPNPIEAVAKPELDAQNKYILINNCNFYETDEFYCGSMGGYAYYYDKASGLSGPLCADPACTHDTWNCGSFIDNGLSLICYDGKRYWVASDPLGSNNFYFWRSDLVGTNRERLKSLDFDELILPYQPQRYVIHRGRLYILGEANTVEGTEVGFRISLLSMSLDSSEEFTVLYDKTFQTGVEMTVRFVGDSIYLSAFSFSPGRTEGISITKLGIHDGSAETVYEGTGSSELLGRIWVTNQGEIYLPGEGQDRAYVWKIENGKRTEVFSWEGLASTPKVVDGIAILTYKKDDIRWIDVADLSGNALYCGKMFTEELPEIEGDPNKYYYTIVGGDTEKIIVNLITSPESGNGDAIYTLLLDLRNNLKPTVLWCSEG